MIHKNRKKKHTVFQMMDVILSSWYCFTNENGYVIFSYNERKTESFHILNAAILFLVIIAPQH